MNPSSPSNNSWLSFDNDILNSTGECWLILRQTPVMGAGLDWLVNISPMISEMTYIHY